MSGSNPLAAVLASEGQGSNPLAMAGNVINMARGAQDLKTSQFNLQQSQLQPGYQAMRMLMATNPNPTNDDINAALGGAARLGGNVDGLVANFTDWTARGGKPADFMRATALGGMSPWEQGQLAGPQMQARPTAQGTYYGTVGGAWSPNANVFQPTGFVEKGFTPGEATEMITVTGPDGRPYQVPKGVYYGTGTPGSGGGGPPGAGGGGGSGGGAGFGGGPLLPPGAPQADQEARLQQIAQRESGNQNILNRQGPQGSPLSSASGIYQMIDSTWQHAAQLAGINTQQYPRAINAPPQLQHAAALALMNEQGEQPWAASAPQGRGGGGGGGGPPAAGPFVGATSAQPVSSAGGMQYFPASPGGGQGGGGFRMPGVVQTPSGPILTPPAPWMGPLWEQSAKEYSGAVSREAGLGSRIQPFQTAISIIKANPDLQTGPTSSQWNNYATALSQWGIQLPSMPGNTVAAWQELSKALHQGLVNSGAFSSTDMARIEAEASMPNMDQKVEAIRELSARQIGYERFQLAQLKYFRSLHPGEDPDQHANQYRSQTSQWASNLDPVAFGADNLTKDEITAYRQGLTPQQDEKFLRSLTEAHRLYPEITPGGQ